MKLPANPSKMSARSDNIMRLTLPVSGSRSHTAGSTLLRVLPVSGAARFCEVSRFLLMPFMISRTSRRSVGKGKLYLFCQAEIEAIRLSTSGPLALYQGARRRFKYFCNSAITDLRVALFSPPNLQLTVIQSRNQT